MNTFGIFETRWRFFGPSIWAKSLHGPPVLPDHPEKLQRIAWNGLGLPIGHQEPFCEMKFGGHPQVSCQIARPLAERNSPPKHFGLEISCRPNVATMAPANR